MNDHKPMIPFTVLAILMLASCMRSPDCFREDEFCAALVTDTLGIIDHGINQDSWAGLQQLKEDGSVDQVAHIESVDTRDYEKNIAYFAQDGFDVIVTSGVGLRDETLRAADLYPDTVFIGMDQPQDEARPNLLPVTFAEDQMGYLAGVLATRLTETRVVGAVCETSGLDSMWRYCEGFRAGATFVDENIKVHVIYRDDGSSERLFIDDAWGYETAQKLIRRGADVIFAAGGGTGQGALRAASEEPVNAIGAERDQAEALGEAGSGVITSIYGRAGYEVQMMIRALRQGNAYGPRVGQFGYVFLDERFPVALREELDELLSSLIDGNVQTNVPLQRP